ncbi:MAG: tetratricopeptide repeat protein [Acidobacteria bacterium]|nr:tetratricopeptide repeat protein [Acidobacteriota bacterium]
MTEALTNRMIQLEQAVKVLKEEFGKDLPLHHVIQSINRLEQRLENLETRLQDEQDSAVGPSERELRQTNDYAVQLFYMNELDQAAQLLGDLSHKYTDECVVWNNLGAVYTAMGKDDLAQAALRKALECNPQAVQSMNNQGVLALLDEHPENALEVLEEAQRHEQHNIKVLLNLAQAYAALDQPDRAVELWRRVLTIDEGQVEAQQSLKQYYQQ